MVSFSLAKSLLFALAVSQTQAIAISSASIPENLSSENPVLAAKRDLQKRANTCGNSSFVGRTSSSSPFVVNCQVLRDQQAGTSRVYTVPARSTSWVRLASFGSCFFGAKTSANYAGNVGNEDIRDLINDSIARFASGGFVGAEGTMPCTGGAPGGAPTGVQWTIFRA